MIFYLYKFPIEYQRSLSDNPCYKCKCTNQVVCWYMCLQHLHKVSVLRIRLYLKVMGILCFWGIVWRLQGVGSFTLYNSLSFIKTGCSYSLTQIFNISFPLILWERTFKINANLWIYIFSNLWAYTFACLRQSSAINFPITTWTIASEWTHWCVGTCVYNISTRWPFCAFVNIWKRL